MVIFVVHCVVLEEKMARLSVAADHFTLTISSCTEMLGKRRRKEGGVWSVPVIRVCHGQGVPSAVSLS